MDVLLQDLRYAARQLAARPGFTAAAVLTLALGIGATTTVFSLFNAAVLRPVSGIADADRVRNVTGSFAASGGDVVSYPVAAELREATRAFESLAAYTPDHFSLATDGRAERVSGVIATENYFDALGVRPLHGRLFGPEHAVGGDGAPVVVLGHDFWVSRFGADPAVVGQTVRLNGQPVMVAGVTPRGFSGTLRFLRIDVWVPLSMQPLMDGNDRLGERGSSFLMLFGRLAPGATPEQGASDLAAAVRAGAEAQGSAPAEPPAVRLTAVGRLPGDADAALLGFTGALLILSVLVVLIAAANVGGMLLARAAARRREVAVRLALGAGRGRLVRQLTTESALLFLLGGGAGVLLALWGTRLLLAMRPPMDLPVTLDLSPDGRVLLFALVVSLATGIGFGLAPARRASRPGVIAALRGGAADGGAGRSRLRSAYVVSQVAVSLLLLAVAGLFLRAVQTATAIDLGFAPKGVYTALFDLGIQGYDVESSVRFMEALRERAAAIPGVESVSMANNAPLSFGQNSISVAPVPADGGEAPRPQGVDYNVVDEGYFETLRLPLLAGRAFGAADAAGAPRVAVVNEEMAHRMWPGANPVGQTLRIGADAVEVVGVARNAAYYSAVEAPQPFLYLPYAQSPGRTMTLFLRGHTDPPALLAALREEVRALDPYVPVLDPQPLPALVRTSLLPQRLAAAVSGTVGVLGLLLAAVGLYGVLAFAVVQRTRELGIRLALGASASDVGRLVVGGGLRLTLAGVAVGLALALLATRLLEGLLLGVSPADPLAFLGVVALLAAVAAIASYLPARRAARVDPMVALRSE